MRVRRHAALARHGGAARTERPTPSARAGSSSRGTSARSSRGGPRPNGKPVVTPRSLRGHRAESPPTTCSCTQIEACPPASRSTDVNKLCVPALATPASLAVDVLPLGHTTAHHPSGFVGSEGEGASVVGLRSSPHGVVVVVVVAGRATDVLRSSSADAARAAAAHTAVTASTPTKCASMATRSRVCGAGPSVCQSPDAGSPSGSQQWSVTPVRARNCWSLGCWAAGSVRT